MDSPTHTSPSSTSPGKRPRDSSPEHQIKLRSQSPPHLQPSRIGGVSPEEHGADEYDTQSIASTTKSRRFQVINSSDRACGKQPSLTKSQHRLLRQWYEDFAQPDVAPSLSDDYIIAFATAIRARSELVIGYVRRRRRSIGTAEHAAHLERKDQESSRSPETAHSSIESYTLAEDNSHLPPTTLNLVKKYISACRRRRSPNDGRRSVNTGPYRCTFDCGYRTKRAFDWRRHEETHEPQELWLCCICSQIDMINPFLVNRKDKFLKHATDKHIDSGAETVLDKSKLAYIPRAELGCRYCGEESGNWDERCRHVLGHFEDEVARNTKRVKVIEKNREDEEEIPTGDERNAAGNVGSAIDSQKDRS
jgi:hypothetical protein